MRTKKENKNKNHTPGFGKEYSDWLPCDILFRFPLLLQVGVYIHDDNVLVKLCCFWKFIPGRNSWYKLCPADLAGYGLRLWEMGI